MTWLLDLVLSDLPFPGIYRDEQNILQMRSVWHRVCVCVCVCVCVKVTQAWSAL